MACLIKCLECGEVHEHETPIALVSDISGYTCSSCKAVGNAKILRGVTGMFGGIK